MKLFFYENWQQKRLDKIIDIFGRDWFAGKQILELGACHGDIGIALAKLGAIVTFADYRQKHLDSIDKKLKDYNIPYNLILLDQEEKWSLSTTYDLTLHLGVLFHLENWKQDLECAMNHSNLMILETLVNIAKMPDMSIKFPTDDFMQDYIGKTNIISSFCQESVEGVLTRLRCKYIRFDNSILNSDVSWDYGKVLTKFIYDWDYVNNFREMKKNGSKVNVHHRRFWLVIK